MGKYCSSTNLSIDESYPSKSSLMTTNSNGTETKCIMCFYKYFIRSLHESTKEVFILRFNEQNGFQ